MINRDSRALVFDWKLHPVKTRRSLRSVKEPLSLPGK
jgi:hypothetical protein